MRYNINETFYSLKGEGVWTGTPMFFIRLAGCNLNCEWCDTDYEEKRTATEDELAKEALQYPSRRLVITGGEPLLQDLKPLVNILHHKGFSVHLETNGTQPINAPFDWIANSPKSSIYTLNDLTLRRADEFKFICGTPNWKEHIEYFFNYINPIGKKWLMPLAKPYPFKLQDGLIDENIQLATQYCLDHPDFSLCMQMHKIIGIK